MKPIFMRDYVVSQCHFIFFLGAKTCLLLFNFPVSRARKKNCAIFIGCNFESGASQVGLHNQKKDTVSAKNVVLAKKLFRSACM